MNLAIGLVLVAVACCFAWWIVRIAGNSIKNYDESEHESFLGK
ncbi:hypothetical protein Back11_14130 [Paenibacillus baekrokdamisoli]|uniref:Uncharacterized protein n=1 Tax=Paenibacillus baekrokdamisoli TaxID=1712516 RepID=A0A3G9J8B2_9BACL|nr:hypothetical protein [Paenibacillus baekrokdamisoli]MBB3070719.1 hypothetical protein [Paenibacillus baekrokdamisoli]BBH20068.1 hypothetical protein Back11_14130 [Paenibacillus baekrokdamisoli]